MTDSSVPVWMAEVDKDGNLITSDKDEFLYTVTYPGHADGKLTVVCGEKTEGTLQNQLNN